MNFKKLLLFLAAPLMLVLTGCESTPIVPTYADCQVVDFEGNAITSVNFSAEQGSQKILIKATRSWTISNTADWFAVNPVNYNNRDNSEQTTEVTIDVFANDGEARSQAISIACGDLKPVEITVAQAGQGQTALGEVLYYDNFDKKDAPKGSDGYYPYMSAEYGNPTPASQSGVTYASNNVTARNNSNSNGSYSDCANEASGGNNIFFGKAPNYLTISGISLAELEGNALTLKFATEKYSQDNGSKFTESEFRVYISADGAKWTEIDYTFAGTAEGRWNIATAQFNLKEVPSTVSLYFTASVASSYRLDDVKLIAGGGGAELDLAAGTAIDGSGSGNTGGDNTGGDNGGTSGGTVDATIPEGAVVWNIGVNNQTWAAETHATLGAGFSATVDNLKVGCYKYNSTTDIITAKDDHFRVYKNSALVIEPLDGRTITKVVMLCTDPYSTSIYTWDMAVSDGTTAVSDQTAKAISWTGSTTKFEAYAVNGQVRIKTLAVVLDGEGSGTVTPDPTPDPEPTPDPTPDPEPTPGEIATIASVLALGQNATIPASTVIEGVVISNMDLNNLTSKKGLYIQDATAGLQFYLGANHEFKFGDKVTVDLSGATIGAYNGAVQISGLALDKITKISSGNEVVAKTVSIADFLANKYEGQYVAIEGVQVAEADLAKTWVMGGAHTSINMEDANGNKFVVFSSKYATYGASTVAQGSGTIKGISSINNGTIQIIFGQASDYADLTGARFGQQSGGDDNTGDDNTGDDNTGTTTPDTPAAGEWAGRDDFNTVSHNSSYTDRATTAGWVATYCAVQSGGASDANPVLPSLLGSSTDTRAFCIKGAADGIGTITSPVLTTGCGKLKFTYGLAFTDKNGVDMDVTIMQNGQAVKTINVKKTCSKYEVQTFEEEINVAGEFQIVFTNKCPSQAASGNKDRVSIWDVMWTAHN